MKKNRKKRQEKIENDRKINIGHSKGLKRKNF